MRATAPRYGTAVMCLVAAIALAGVFARSPAQAQRPGAAPLVRHYEGRAIELRLDTARLAVFAAGDNDQMEIARVRLARLGIAAADLAPYNVNGWAYVKARQFANSREQIETWAGNIAAAGAADFVSPVVIDEAGYTMHATPDVLVRFQDNINAQKALAAIVAIAPNPAAVEADFGGMKNVYRVRGVSANGFDVIACANVLTARPDVLWAEVDWMVTGELLGGFPNDPSFPGCWGHENTGQAIGCNPCLGWNAPVGVVDMDMDTLEAWAIETGAPAVWVGIFDTGINQTHADINQITPGYDMVNQGGDGGPWTVCDTHGTGVAGVVTARIDNGIGGVGVAPTANSISFKIGNQGQDGGGNCNNQFQGYQASNVVTGLAICENIGVSVTNHSYGVASSNAISDAFEDAFDAGIIHFAASGNGGGDSIGDGTLSFPASVAEVNAVSGIDPDGTKCGFSNFGVGLMFSAPGVGVCGTGSCFCGTSGSSPSAAGVAALILSANDTLSPTEVANIMAQTATDLGSNGYDTTYGWGLVNAYQAVLDAFGCPAPGSCFDEHGTPGCNIADCCGQVCAIDPFCCENFWDVLCVENAVEICLGCPGDGPCDQAHGGVGCNVLSCCEAVCLIDSFCCNAEFGWDNVCVAIAIDACNLAPTNDDCQDAIPITDGVTPFTISNAGNDGVSHINQCDWNAEFMKDVWFKYTSTCTGFLTVSTCGTVGFDTWLAVYDGNSACPPGVIPLLACEYDTPGCANNTSRIEGVFVTQGDTYLIRVGALNPQSGSGVLSVSCEPLFDTCDGAFFLGSFEGNFNINNRNADTDGFPHFACSGGGNNQITRDVWFDWVAPCTGTVTVQTCGSVNFNTKLAIYEGCGCPATTDNLLGCNDNAPNCANNGSRVSVPVIENQCYKIRVGSVNNAQGSGQVNIVCNPAPPNDDCENASLTFLGIPTPFTTDNSFTDGVHHAECGSQIVHDVWFRRTATCTGFMTVSTCGSADYDTMIAVYDGCDCVPGDNRLLGCNNNAPNCAANGSRVTVPVYEGRCYLVRVGAPPTPVLTAGGNEGETGSGSITFACFDTCDGDANVDGVVNVDDLLMVINNWGACDGPSCPGDLNSNGVVDVDDLLLVINNWGNCFPT